MTENEFADLVDCNWPYLDLCKSQKLIELGLSISDNAAFVALNEICHPPKGKVHIPKLLLLETIEYWRSKFGHPLAAAIADCAIRKINGEQITVAEAVTLMHQVAQHPGLFAALSIPYLSCDDVAGEAERHYEQIIRDWATVSNPPELTARPA